MAETSELKVKFTAESAQLNSALDTLGTKLKSIGQQIKPIGTAFAVAGAAIVGSMGLAIKSAEDERVNIARLDIMLKNVGISYDQVSESLEKNIALTQRKTGIADNEQRDILGRLVLVTKDYNKALSLLPLTLDLAAAGQMSATTAATYLGKAIEDLENGAESISIRLGHSTLQFKNLDEVQKAVGGTAEATANQFTILSAEFGNLAEKVGVQFLPMLRKVVDNLLPVIDSIGEWVKANPALVEAIAKFGVALLVAATALKGTAILLAIVNALKGPEGWIALGVAVAVAGGAYFGLNKLMENTIDNMDGASVAAASNSTAVGAVKSAAEGATSGVKSYSSSLEGISTGSKKVIDSTMEMIGVFNAFNAAQREGARSFLLQQQEMLNFEMMIERQRAQRAGESVSAASTGILGQIVALQAGAVGDERGQTFFDRLISDKIQEYYGSLEAQNGLPKFANGGVVSGALNKPQLAVVHGGETITPAGESGGITVNVYGSIMSERDLVDAVWSGLLQRKKGVFSLGIS